jgi:hypothetical protein
MFSYDRDYTLAFHTHHREHSKKDRFLSSTVETSDIVEERHVLPCPGALDGNLCPILLFYYTVI